MSNELALAFIEQIRADAELTVHDGRAPDLAVPPYVVVHIADDDYADRLPYQSNMRELYGYTHCVGANAQTSRNIKDHVRVQLLDVVLVVSGWMCSPIRHLSSSAPQTVEVASKKYVDQVDAWRFHADPDITP